VRVDATVDGAMDVVATVVIDCGAIVDVSGRVDGARDSGHCPARPALRL
jgi:hypothetical protein